MPKPGHMNSLCHQVHEALALRSKRDVVVHQPYLLVSTARQRLERAVGRGVGLRDEW